MLTDRSLLSAHIFTVTAPGMVHTILVWHGGLATVGAVKWCDLDGDETPHTTTALGLVKYAAALGGPLEHIEGPIPAEWTQEDEAAEARMIERAKAEQNR